MPSPDPEADMLHMQHAHVVALLVRQHEAAHLKAQQDVAAEARRAATTGQADPERPGAPVRRAPQVHRPRPA